MADPTKKSKEIETLLSEILKEIPGASSDRRTAILEDRCVICGQPATEFSNELSEKEFSISGMCQRCQDDIFGA